MGLVELEHGTLYDSEELQNSPSGLEKGVGWGK